MLSIQVFTFQKKNSGSRWESKSCLTKNDKKFVKSRGYKLTNPLEVSSFGEKLAKLKRHEFFVFFIRSKEKALQSGSGSG